MSRTHGRMDVFFRWISRINSVLLLALILVAGVVTFSASGLGGGRNDVAMEGAVAVRHASTPAWHLGMMRSLDGTSMLYAALKARDASSTVSFSGSVSTRVGNVLFFDIATQQPHWLFADNRQVISPPEVLKRKLPAASPGAKASRQAVALIFGVRPAAADPKATALWNIDLASVDGQRVETLATGVDGMMGFHFTPDQKTLLVFYTAHGDAYVLDADLDTLKVLSNRKLTVPGNEPGAGVH